MAGQRIGVLGANGQGKSTLIKTIARTLAPLDGEYTQGKGLSIGYFAQQELDVLRESDSALQHLQRLAREAGPSAREQELRNFLGTFRFSNEMAAQAVGTMSGGEKARLVLAMLVWQRPNLLLLDEPTNHLDLVTREALALALNGFEGALLLVSHDRALLRAVCDEFWLVADGRHPALRRRPRRLPALAAGALARRTEGGAEIPARRRAGDPQGGTTAEIRRARLGGRIPYNRIAPVRTPAGCGDLRAD